MLCKAHGGQAVGRFARLGNNNHQITRPDKRLPVAKFGGNVYCNGYARELFDHIFTNHAGVHGRTAGDHKNLAEGLDFVKRNAAFFQAGQALLDPWGHGCFNRRGLFVDFFDHKVLVAAFFGSVHVPVGSFELFFDLLPVQVVYFYILVRQHGNFVVLQQVIVFGIF